LGDQWLHRNNQITAIEMTETLFPAGNLQASRWTAQYQLNLMNYESILSRAMSMLTRGHNERAMNSMSAAAFE
jgi:hypothetical protein